ncbi:glycosyltransferase family 4 protein [Chloroflexales bacterium ZM16-3]|nr:glycosyltransferase family 4 protein [Chloroflexales bacterium ZM16-3]
MSRRIIYLNPTAVHGGAEDALLQMMRLARGLTLEPVLVTPESGWLTDRCREQQIPCELLPSLPNIVTNDSWHTQLRPWFINAVAVAQLVRKWDACIVHSNNPRAAYHGGLGARLARVMAVTHCHDIVNIPYRSIYKARLLDWLTDWTLVPSNAVQKVIVKAVPWLAPRIRTLYNGWDSAMFDVVSKIDLRTMFGLPSDTVVIGSVAAMTPWKGQDLLIDAFRLLAPQDARLRLMLVGSAQGRPEQQRYEASLHERVAAYGLNDRVIFTGWREDALAIMKALDIVVHVPTQPDPLPTVLIQASALARPIVAAAIGGVPEIVPADERCGLLVQPSDPSALAEALRNLVGNTVLQTELAANAHRRFLTRFSQAQMAAGLAETYQHCVPTGL